MHILYIVLRIREADDNCHNVVPLPKAKAHPRKKEWIEWLSQLQKECSPCIYSFRWDGSPDKHFLWFSPGLLQSLKTWWRKAKLWALVGVNLLVLDHHHNGRISSSPRCPISTAASACKSHRLTHRLFEGCSWKKSHRSSEFRCRLQRYCNSWFYVYLLINFFHPGILSCLDGYMNIALEQTEEHVEGKITNRYGDAFIRGNNGG